jgi:acetoin utilization protein AcuC
MFRSLRVKRAPEPALPPEGSLTAEQLNQDPGLPITLRQINSLPDNAKRRIYRTLLPTSLLVPYGIDPISWKGPGGEQQVRLKGERDTGSMSISVRKTSDSNDDVLTLELADNAYDGIELNLILINDPDSLRFGVDKDEEGKDTHFGTARRNLAEEERAMKAGLAPAQVRSGLKASRQVMENLENFLLALGQRLYFLEPLTYASAWVFERRGFAYVRGHRLMDDIHAQFQPGGRLYQALDGSSPFRQPDQWNTVRGRAWAIQDGILEALNARWDGLRMVKQIGRDAGVETFPGSVF